MHLKPSNLEKAVLGGMAEMASLGNFISVLQKCRKNKDLASAKRVHALICNNGLESHAAVGNYIVPMFVECGSMSDAQQVFSRLIHRNEHSWTSLMSGYIENGESQYALDLYQKMQEDSVHPSSYTLMALLKACARLKDIEKGREIHDEISRKGWGRDVFVGSTLVDMYSKCGSLAQAHEVFDRLPTQDAVSWTALIAGYAEHGPGQEALKCYEQMQLEGISPDGHTFVCALKACGNIGSVDKGREVHDDIARKGADRDNLVGSNLVDMYAKCGSLVDAHKIFEKLPAQDILSWNALIAGYAEHGPEQKALNCFGQMQLGGVSPDAITLVCALKACGSLGATDNGRKLHADITQKGFEGLLYVGNTLVDMYAKCGSLMEAHKVFDKLPVRNVVSWTALISGYAEHGPYQQALNCYEQMQLEDVCPDAVTFVCILKACGSIGAINKGREIHTDLAQKGFESGLLVGSTLIDMYAKCGSLAEALEIFEKLSIHDIVSWNALIAGYAEHGHHEEVLKCFEQMQLEGMFPNVVTYLCVLKACSSIGAIDRGREIHADITHKGFESDVSVGNTLIDMYSKCGLLAWAHEVFDQLLVRDVVAWTALIAGYGEHGPGEKALTCFEQMQLEGVPPNAVTIICVLKACGSMGARDKGHEIHTNIAEKGFERDVSVGNTLIDMYAKCGSLSEAREVFDKLPVRDVVSWNAMIKAYGMNQECNRAVQCFEDMQQEGVAPDDVTFTCLLTACSRARLVLKGQEFFNMMREQYGIAPTIDHYTCMVDLLAQSGHLYEALNLVETKPCSPTWTALLGACKVYGEEALGLRCFEQLVHINPDSAIPYVLMGKIYASAGRWDEVYKLEELRKHAGAKKKPAVAMIEVNKKVHEFVVGNNQSREIAAMLDFLSSRMEVEGHVPNINLDLRCISDEEKEATLCEHAEKMAIAFGLLNTPQGQTLRVTKNLRMCSDCHNTSKIISKIERREIVIRDICQVHHFKDGLCSCRDIC